MPSDSEEPAKPKNHGQSHTVRHAPSSHSVLLVNPGITSAEYLFLLNSGLSCPSTQLTHVSRCSVQHFFGAVRVLERVLLHGLLAVTFLRGVAQRRERKTEE